MASLFANTIRARPLLVGTALVGVATTTYYVNNRKLLLDSAGADRKTTFSFPNSMIFAKQLTVTEVEQINHDTKRITFALPGGPNDLTGIPSGAALLTQHTPSTQWFPVLRPYTPVQDPDSTGIVQLLVKQYPNGKASTYLHSLERGSKLTVRGPIPGYSWKASTSPRDVLFVAGGAGITPLYSLTRAIVTDKQDQTRINLLWGVNGTRDIVLKKELEDLQSEYPDKLRVTYIVSGPEGKADAPSLGEPEKYRKGYIDRALLSESIQKCSQGQFGDEKGVKVFFCGPEKMQSSITGRSGILNELGVAKKSTHVF